MRARIGQKQRQNRLSAGFTMIELIIAVTIVAVLAILALTQLPNQLRRARDAQRKKDLQAIKVAFEDYYNDQGQYPEEDVLLVCGSEAFNPYIRKIPCDPGNEQPYVYVPHPSSVDRSGGFRVFAALESDSDQAITTLNCEGGCGLDESMIPTGNTFAASAYNYGVSQGVPVSFNSPTGGGEPVELQRCGGGICNSCDPEVHNDCVSAAVCAATCGN